jgi:hypothetical protein
LQTFLPDSSFYVSALSLDNKRLNKQRIECIQILKALSPSGSGWKNHPAVLMWKGCEGALIDYWQAIEDECLERGFKPLPVPCKENYNCDLPPWVGDDRLHLTHRLSLLYKDPSHYVRWFEEIPPTDKPEYFWPTHHKDYSK